MPIFEEKKSKSVDAQSDYSKRQMLLIREVFIDKCLIYFVGISFAAMVINIWRSSVTGWLPSYSLVLLLSLGLSLIVHFRGKFSIIQKGGIMMALLLLAVVQGLIAFGLMAGALLWIPIVCMVSAVVFSRRITWISIVFCLLILLCAAYFFVSKSYVLSADLNAYQHHLSSWFNLILVVVGGCVMVSMAMNDFVSSFYMMSVSISNQRDEIERLANHDHLTGLPLLRLAVDRGEVALSLAKRYQQKVSLLFLDLDGFKSVNDKYGHAAGDYLLKEVANRLKKIVRESDTIARIGGDEFIVLLTGLESEKASEVVAKKIISSISSPIAYRNQALTVGVSIGIGTYPDDASSFESLRRVADSAMYSVKYSTKNGYAFASSSLSEQKMPVIYKREMNQASGC